MPPSWDWRTPVTGEPLSFKAPIPADMQGLLAALTADQRAHAKVRR